MSAIAGVLTGDRPAPNRSALERMVQALHHRGPRGSGIFRDARVALGHCSRALPARLRPDGGRHPGADRGACQPLCAAQGRLWIVFDGTLTNGAALGAELEASGQLLRTRSDAEVALLAVRQWGEDGLRRLEGGWACAIWDAPEQRLLLARDRFGIRPLVWAEHRGRLWFASEVAALFAGNPGLPRRLDPLGLNEAFTFWAPVPPRTVFAGICELEPGHVRIHTPSQVREVAFASPAFPERGGERPARLEEAVELVRFELRRATSTQLRLGEGRVGAYLSGGLDSALLCAFAREASPAALRTFSVRFRDPALDEGPFQRELAQALGTAHAELLVSPWELAECFPEAVRRAERPLFRTVPAALWLLARKAAGAGMDAVLSGEGADELFAGSELFREAKVRRFCARQPDSALRRRLLERLHPLLARAPVAQEAIARRFFGRDPAEATAPGGAHRPRWETTSGIKALLSEDLRRATQDHDAVGALFRALPGGFSGWSPLARDQAVELHTLLAGYLLPAHGDRMPMAHGLEGRFPYLDPGLAALAQALPARFKLLGLDEKHVLKRAGAGLLPAAVLARRKRVLRGPGPSTFLEADAPGWVREVLSPGALEAAGVFDPLGVAQLVARCEPAGAEGERSARDQLALVAVLSTQLLHRELVERAPARPSAPPLARSDPAGGFEAEAVSWGGGRAP